MRLSNLKNQKILILGFGKEGKETFVLLRKLFPAKKFTVADRNPRIRVKDTHISFQLGPNYLQHLDRFDVIIKSPGIPFSPELQKVKKCITSATQLFFDNLDASNTVIGVTGSKGKSTVVTLIYEILRAAKLPVRLIGNIGNPALKYINAENTVFVYELSSYQLDGLRARPHIAVFTHIFPEHLNYHGGFRRYFSAKKNITRYQRSDDVFIFQNNVKLLHSIPTRAEKIMCGVKNGFWHDGKYFFCGVDTIFPTSTVKIPGNHNLDNILLVLAVLKQFDISYALIKKVLSSFHGLPHRLQCVGKFQGIYFYDDAISTTPESTIAAIEIFQKRLGTIILGGEDRGYDFRKLVEVLLKYNVRNVVLFPDTGKRILKCFLKQTESCNDCVRFFETDTMKDAVRFCFENTPRSKVCLLSTASPSYSIFKNFEEKGRLFQRFVKKL